MIHFVLLGSKSIIKIQRSLSPSSASSPIPSKYYSFRVGLLQRLGSAFNNISDHSNQVGLLIWVEHLFQHYHHLFPAKWKIVWSIMNSSHQFTSVHIKSRYISFHFEETHQHCSAFINSWILILSIPLDFFLLSRTISRIIGWLQNQLNHKSIFFLLPSL